MQNAPLVILTPHTPQDRFRKYVGHCIYCGVLAPAAELGDEHVAPAGLMGVFILEKASCKKCATITSYFEGKALRGVFGPVRDYEFIGSKRHKKRPQDYVTFDNGDGTVERIPVSAFERPYLLGMPLLPPAGILAGRDRNLGFPPGIQAHIHTHDAGKRRMRDLQSSDPKKREIVTYFDFGNLTKFIAKTGYCFAKFFIDEPFEPVVLDLILAEKTDCTLGAYFVGGAIEQPGVSYPPLPTERKFSTVIRTERIGDQAYVIARSQFFNDRGMPIYDTVVGQLTPEQFSASMNRRAKAAQAPQA